MTATMHVTVHGDRDDPRESANEKIGIRQRRLPTAPGACSPRRWS